MSGSGVEEDACGGIGSEGEAREDSLLQLSELVPSVCIMTCCCRFAFTAFLLLDLCCLEEVLALFRGSGGGSDDKKFGIRAAGPTAGLSSNTSIAVAVARVVAEAGAFLSSLPL